MQIQYFESIANTNTHLLSLTKKNAKSWTVVWTDNQTEGRGYAGNRWQAQAGENIALSLLLINDLTYNELVFFNQWVSNNLAAVLKKYTDDVFVKWPNDLILTDKKICGILIETRKAGNELFIVTGMGLNINQTQFDYPKAGSLKIKTRLKYDLKEIVADILTVFENNYDQIEKKEWQKIAEEYNSLLFRKNQLSRFKEGKDVFEAVIFGVDDEGKLILKMNDGGFRHFAHKSVELLY